MKNVKKFEWGNLFSKKKRPTIVSALKQVMLFENLSTRQLKKIAEISHVRTFKKNEVVFYKNDPSYGMYVILRGKVKICLKNKVLQEYEPFDYFGEFGLIRESERTATAISLRKSTLLFIPEPEIKDIFKHDTQMTIEVYENVFKTLVNIISKYDREFMKLK